MDSAAPASRLPVAPKAVLFDAYGTLLHLEEPVANLRRGLAAAGYPHDAETVAEAFRIEVEYYRKNQDRGRDTAGLEALRAHCAATFADALPSHPPDRIATEILTDALRYRLFDDVLPTLDELSSRGIRCAVVSNWDCSLPDVLVQLGVLERFAAVSVSAVVGARKPDPRVFRHALGNLGLEPSQVIHVGDDRDHVVAGARSAGVRAVLLDRAGHTSSGGGECITSLRSVVSFVR